MARFDVYASRGGAGFLPDVQTDLITRLNTRVVTPILPLDAAPAPADRLNPIVEVQGSKVYMATQLMAAVAHSELTMLIASVDRESDAIFSAIDFQHHGWYQIPPSSPPSGSCRGNRQGAASTRADPEAKCRCLND